MLPMANNQGVDNHISGLPFKIGLACIDVTPETRIRMAGYSGRPKPSEAVADQLRAKAIAIEAATGERAILITADLVGFDRRFADAICEDIRRETGLRRAQVLLNASHTHAGPILGTRYSLAYDLSLEEGAKVETYNNILRQRMVELVVAALADLSPAQLSWATGVASFAINRREFTSGGVCIGLNPRGYVDRSVPVMRVDKPDGCLRGVVFGYACHNTTLTRGNMMISADYAGFAQRWVEAASPGACAMFVQGCGASANPYPRHTYELAQRHGETLGAEVCRVLAGDFQPVRGPLHVEFDRVAMPLEPRPTAERLEALRGSGENERHLADQMQQMIDQGHPWESHYRVPIAVWQFGEDLTMVWLPSEVVGEYVPMLEKALGPLGLWISGYCNDDFGYVRTAQIHEEGGYEGCDFITGVGFMARSTEEAVLRETCRLAEQAGRALP